VLRVRPRIYHDGEIALGPGKAALLEAIADTGSIRLAAKGLDMSYMRAWTLVRTMNRCFTKPLVQALRGGREGGSARLTPEGRAVLALYRQIVVAGHRAGQPYWRRIERRLAR
jgi:molybdate transport system regulatory protein